MRSWHGCNPNKQGEDVAVPMASLPTGMSGRNWMLRRLLVESIRRDPAWNSGNYTTQPPSLQLASVFFATATSGGNHSYMKAGPNREKADAALEARLKPGAFNGDANDHLYQWESSADYNPSPGLEKITATLLRAAPRLGQ
jgi:homoserine O-acetyltransferase